LAIGTADLKSASVEVVNNGRNDYWGGVDESTSSRCSDNSSRLVVLKCSVSACILGSFGRTTPSSYSENACSITVR